MLVVTLPCCGLAFHAKELVLAQADKDNSHSTIVQYFFIKIVFKKVNLIIILPKLSNMD